MAVFAEVTRAGHGHGGAGWELGRCLWHQTKTRSGQDRNASMREPKIGDEVFHLVSGLSAAKPRQRFLWGRSLVADPVKVVSSPPNPGDWPDRGDYYRIELSDAVRANPPAPLDAIIERERSRIMSEIGPTRIKYYLFSPHGDSFRITQGIYLTRLSDGLAAAFRDSLAQRSL